jgi:hypothetical protein
MPRTTTKYYQGIIPKDKAGQYYQYLRDSVPWVDGIYSKCARKITRRAYSMDTDSSQSNLTEYDRIIQGLIDYCVSRVKVPDSYITLGAYINYYRDGNDWAPSHRHHKQVQMIISLGATRDLIVGDKTYTLNSGDVIIFGSSTHGVPIQQTVNDGRISIATFMIPITQNSHDANAIILSEEALARLLDLLGLEVDT